MKKNLLFFIYIKNLSNIDDVTKLHLKNIEKFKHLFDGEKIVYLAVDDVQNFENHHLNIFNFLEDFKIKIVKNHENNRESEYLIEMMEYLPKDESISFYCHNKGSTHDLDESLRKWIDIMYFFNLSNLFIEKIENNLNSNFYSSGVLLKDCFCTGHDQSSNWHYSGAFFWIKMSKILKIPNWNIITKGRMGLEFYLSGLFGVEKAFCTFYKENYNFAMNDETWSKILSLNFLPSQTYKEYKKFINNQ